ncbi:hypothetical protein ISG10_34935, partial [Burkholderia pseudomallei]|nr:hypothetical protein [Burkholderia pseudomallei]MBF3542857.1 hypothetical protein [Burkholderia pseudomallei]MBF3604989.1 hypothetical protein [Burkholderia pseudomallei]MBF3605011.1 hypothetical protein [Burkholderia pseudomallei]
ASAPSGTKKVTVNGKALQCPNVVAVSQVKWLSIPTGGSKSITMRDGTKITVSIKR